VQAILPNKQGGLFNSISNSSQGLLEIITSPDTHLSHSMSHSAPISFTKYFCGSLYWFFLRNTHIYRGIGNLELKNFPTIYIAQ
jgi:hypothetical protein